MFLIVVDNFVVCCYLQTTKQKNTALLMMILNDLAMLDNVLGLESQNWSYVLSEFMRKEMMEMKMKMRHQHMKGISLVIARSKSILVVTSLKPTLGISVFKVFLF